MGIETEYSGEKSYKNFIEQFDQSLGNDWD